MIATRQRIGIANGAIFEVTPYKTNGFQLTLTDEKTGTVLFDKQMILYTLPDAVYAASAETFSDEIEKKKFWELPSYILMELGLDLFDDEVD